MNDDNFSSILEGKIGTHSIIKMANKRDRRCGCSKDETNPRARRNQIRHQDTYADKIISWPDAKYAAAICKGGTIHYQVRAESGISDNWILNFFLPVISSKYRQ